MTASLTIPVRFMTIDLCSCICEYYNVDFDENQLDYTLTQDSNVIIANFIVETIMDSGYSDQAQNFILIEDYELYNEERMIDIENFLINHKIPYDSFAANELEKGMYRPGVNNNEPFFIYTHPEIDDMILPTKKILSIIDSYNGTDVQDFKNYIFNNIEKMIVPIPSLEIYVAPNIQKNSSFTPSGLKDLRLMS